MCTWCTVLHCHSHSWQVVVLFDHDPHLAPFFACPTIAGTSQGSSRRGHASQRKVHFGDVNISTPAKLQKFPLSPSYSRTEYEMLVNHLSWSKTHFLFDYFLFATSRLMVAVNHVSRTTMIEGNPAKTLCMCTPRPP